MGDSDRVEGLEPDGLDNRCLATSTPHRVASRLTRGVAGLVLVPGRRLAHQLAAKAPPAPPRCSGVPCRIWDSWYFCTWPLLGLPADEQRAPQVTAEARNDRLEEPGYGRRGPSTFRAWPERMRPDSQMEPRSLRRPTSCAARSSRVPADLDRRRAIHRDLGHLGDACLSSRQARAGCRSAVARVCASARTRRSACSPSLSRSSCRPNPIRPSGMRGRRQGSPSPDGAGSG